jgi:hypothetical protein
MSHHDVDHSLAVNLFLMISQSLRIVTSVILTARALRSLVDGDSNCATKGGIRCSSTTRKQAR